MVEHVASLVLKAPADDAALLRDAARAALQVGDTSGLEQVLRQVFADAYGAGGFAASQQLAGSGGAVVQLAGVSEVDWANWRPGDPAAAGLLDNGGLRTLLDQAGIKVQGITGTLLDQLGNAIGDGVARGASVDALAGDLRGIVGDPGRAVRIAHTETARAVTAATLDSYSANGVGLWDWELSENACPECDAAQAAGPYRVGDATVEPPPLHPLCRCSASPVADSITGSVGGAGGMSTLGGDAAASAAFDEASAALEADTGAEAAVALPEDLSGLGDADLYDAMGSADDAGVDRILAELERRDTAAAAERDAAEKKAAAASRRSAKADQLEAERSARFDELTASGLDPEEAYAEAYGKDLERVRIQAAMSSLRAQGYTGRNFEELCQSQFKEYAERSWEEAERFSRGHMLNKDGEKAGINPRSLFTGQDVRARKYASDELLEWWQTNGRLSVKDFMSANLGQKGELAGKAAYL